MIIIQKVFSIFAQNLAYYNEGSIEGGWLDLPQSSKVIDDYLKNVVKVDNTHEEYEIADVENPTPFPYASIQWSTVENLNKLAIIFNKLSEYQREAVKAHLIYCGEEHYAISEENQGIINFFDFEKYGESFGYDYELLDNGYLISDYDIDLQLYSEEEINEAIKEMEDFEIEI